MFEVFKDIPGYDGKYKVSQFGKVINGISGKLLKFHEQHKGYLRVHPYKNGVRKNEFVHRLVLLTFIPHKMSYKLQVNHKNFNKKDNSLQNLEWATHKENFEHAQADGRGFKFGKDAHKFKDYIICYRDGEVVNKLCGMNEIEAAGFNHRCVYDCVNGKMKYHKGHQFCWEGNELKDVVSFDDAWTFRGAIQAWKNGELIHEMRGSNEIEALGFNRSSVYACVKNRRKTHKGFTFTRKYRD